MAQNDNGWNSFMQSRTTRIALNALCAIICGAYAVGGVLELVHPQDSARMLMEQVGTVGYYALTVARIVVCVWVTVVFGRLTLKTMHEE